MGSAMDNLEAARAVFGVASLLEAQNANPYRVRAYRRAAVGLLRLSDDARRFATDDGQLALPWLGPRLRRKLGELVTRGRMTFYDDLLDALPSAFRELLSVPGVGPKTAQRLILELGVHGLADLVAAARDGRLRTLRGIGEVREQRLVAAAEALLAPAA
jgi:DNA polymerase (family 10)